MLDVRRLIVLAALVYGAPALAQHTHLMNDIQGPISAESAKTAERLKSSPAPCSAGQAPRGVDVYGNAQNCATVPTLLGYTPLSDAAVAWKIGTGWTVSSNTRLGNLTGSANLFKISPTVYPLFFRLRYVLISDRGDQSGAASITAGAKTWMTGLNSSGVWNGAFGLGVTNEVTERTVNTAAVLTISFVNGDASGGYLAVSATNYSGANAAGWFVLEAVTYSSLITVTPQ